MKCHSTFVILGLLACARAPDSIPNATPVATLSVQPPIVVDPAVEFMRGMIAHHAQAIEMARLAPARSDNAQLELLAERIDISQNDETGRMARWLAARGDSAHREHDMAHMERTGETALMPGMLTAEDFAHLRAASGAAFDRLFLELMIRHHEGALTMVQHLFARGTTADPELFQLASGIDADQRAEIARMQPMLSNLH